MINFYLMLIVLKKKQCKDNMYTDFILLSKYLQLNSIHIVTAACNLLEKHKCVNVHVLPFTYVHHIHRIKIANTSCSWTICYISTQLLSIFYYIANNRYSCSLSKLKYTYTVCWSSQEHIAIENLLNSINNTFKYFIALFFVTYFLYTWIGVLLVILIQNIPLKVRIPTKHDKTATILQYIAV